MTAFDTNLRPQVREGQEELICTEISNSCYFHPTYIAILEAFQSHAVVNCFGFESYAEESRILNKFQIKAAQCVLYKPKILTFPFGIPGTF